MAAITGWKVMSGTKKCPGGCGRNISANKDSCDACKERPKGELSILNTGAGDIKISFNTASVSEVIRAKRILTDMLRRGYAIVVEVERNGEKAYERIKEFDEKHGEYVIADLDPLMAREVDCRMKLPTCARSTTWMKRPRRSARRRSSHQTTRQNRK